MLLYFQLYNGNSDTGKFQLIARPGILLQGIKYINSSKTNEKIATSNHIDDTNFLNAGLVLSHSQTRRTIFPIF